MTKEEKQIIDTGIKEIWKIGDRTRLKHLLEKNLKLYRENVELENKIADIKANCDLAIEGRDIKIDELEEKNSYMFDTIALQEQQIEKMKCCENCKHKKSEVDRCELLMYTMNACLCKNKDKWELKE